MQSSHSADDRQRRGSNATPWSNATANPPPPPQPADDDRFKGRSCAPFIDTPLLQRSPFDPESILAERAEIYLGPKLGKTATQLVIEKLPADTRLKHHNSAIDTAIRAVVEEEVETNPFVEADLQEAAMVVSAWIAAEGASECHNPCGWAAMQIVARAHIVARLNTPEERSDSLASFSDILSLAEQLSRNPIIADTTPAIHTSYLHSMAQCFLEKGFNHPEIENSPALQGTLCDFIVRSSQQRIGIHIEIEPEPTPDVNAQVITSLEELEDLLDRPTIIASADQQFEGLHLSSYLRCCERDILTDACVPAGYIDQMSIHLVTHGCSPNSFLANPELSRGFASHLAESANQLAELGATDDLIANIGHLFNSDESWREMNGPAQLFAFLDTRDQEQLPSLSTAARKVVDRICQNPALTMTPPEIPDAYARRLARLFESKGFSDQLLDSCSLGEEESPLEALLCRYISESYDQLIQLGLSPSLIKANGHKFSPTTAAQIIEDTQNAFAQTSIITTVATEVLSGRFGDYDHAVGRALSHFAQTLEEATELFKEIDPNHHWAVSATNKVFKQNGRRTLEDSLGYYAKRKDRREAKKAKKKGVFAYEALLRDDQIPKLLGRPPAELTDDILQLARTISKRLIQRSGPRNNDHFTGDDIQQAAALEGIEMLSQNPTSTREIVARMVLAAQKEASQYSRYHDKGEIQAGLSRDNAEIGYAQFRDD